ncbi:hypothetical protein ERJ75_001677600 [Trypanosoma vivax]|nr:hypothetical protein ERJ75_001677600 [Trypanosoma vivax]
MRCSVACASPQIRNPHFDAGAARGTRPSSAIHATSHARGSKAQPRRREQSRINEWRATQLRGHDAAAHTAAAAISAQRACNTPRGRRGSEAHAREGRAPKRVEHGHGGVLPCRATGHRLEPQSETQGTGRGASQCQVRAAAAPARTRRLAELGAGKGNGPPTAGGTKARIIQPCDAPCDPQRGAPRTVHHTRAHDRPQEPPRGACGAGGKAPHSTGGGRRRLQRHAAVSESKARERTKRPLGTRRLSSVAAAWPKTRKVREQPDDVGRRWRVEGCSEQRDRRRTPRRRGVKWSDTHSRGWRAARRRGGLTRQGKGYSQTG